MTAEFLTLCISDIGAIYSMFLGSMCCMIMVWGWGRG